MKRWLVVALLGAGLVVVLFGLGTVAQAHDGQSDHAILSFVTSDKAGYCGVFKNGEPWEFHASATADNSGPGSLTIQFRDGDSVTFNIPASSSFNLTQEFGGVPGTDDLIRITGTSGVTAIISALARSGAQDPFIEVAPKPAEKDNFCVSLPDEDFVQSRLTPFPFGWNADNNGLTGNLK